MLSRICPIFPSRAFLNRRRTLECLADAKAHVADVAVVYGFVWAGLMFVSAAANAFVALTCSITTWAFTMPIFGIVSKVAVFLGGYAAMHVIAVHRVRAMPAFERDALLASTGRR